MASTPAVCPHCKDEDGRWVYGRLVFDGDEAWPRCMNMLANKKKCNALLVPVSTARIAMDLTSLAQLSNLPADDLATGTVVGAYASSSGGPRGAGD